MDSLFTFLAVAGVAGGVGLQIGRHFTKHPSEADMLHLLVMRDADRKVKSVTRDRLEKHIAIASEAVAKETFELKPEAPQAW